MVRNHFLYSFAYDIPGPFFHNKCPENKPGLFRAVGWLDMASSCVKMIICLLLKTKTNRKPATKEIEATKENGNGFIIFPWFK